MVKAEDEPKLASHTEKILFEYINDAPPDALRHTGRMLCKSLLDDHPIGGGLGGFVFEFLIDVHEQRAFRSPRAALRALAEYDAELAARWTTLLDRTADAARPLPPRTPRQSRRG